MERGTSAVLLRVLGRGMLAWVVAIGVLSSGAAGATSFLKFDGIDGEAQDKDHKNWSEVLDVSWGVGYAGSPSGGGGGGVAKPQFQDLTWTQALDKGVPPLFNAISTGKHIRKATVDFTTAFDGARRVTYFQMTFDDVLLTKLDIGASGNELAQLSGAFEYAKIGMTYTEYDEEGKKKGSVSATYDLKSGKGSTAALAGVFALGASGPRAVIPPIPEPATCVSVLSGLGLLGWHSKRARVSGETKQRS